MTEAPQKKRHWLWRVLPYAIAVVAVTAILWKYPPSRIAQEMRNGDVLAMAPYALLLIATAIFIISASDYVVLSSALPRVPRYVILVRARAAVSLLAMLGYGAGVGGYGVWVARVTGCGAKLAFGVTLYKMSADLIAVSMVATAAIYVGGADVSRGLRIAAPTITVLLLSLKLFSRFSPLSKDKLPVAFHPWRTIAPTRALAAVGVRASNILFITVCVWLGANAFGMQVPLAVMATYFPIILVVGSMPVNVGGFGAVQGAWLLLEPWAANGEQVLAFSVLWNLVVASAITLRGVPFVRAVTREIEA